MGFCSWAAPAKGSCLPEGAGLGQVGWVPSEKQARVVLVQMSMPG